METYRLAARTARPEGTRVRVGHIDIGGPAFVVAAGPCAVESRSQIHDAARAVALAGASLLRGGAFKPRTSPYSFQGLGDEALQMLADAGRAIGLPTVTEVMSVEAVPLVATHADVLQVGARNMQNFDLLRALGSAGKPVLLKRGPASTVEELLLAAEYVLLYGNPDVILCERGIRTFETATRYTLDLAAVALLKRLTHLPVLVDPSHGTGRADLVSTLSCAAVAAGADGLLVEVHPDPERALSDGAQSLSPSGFAAMMQDLAACLPIFGRVAPSGWPALPREQMVDAHRQRIDALDAALVALLNQRARIALQIGKMKRELDWPVRAPDRESFVLDRVSQLAEGPLDASSVVRIFSAIIAETADAECRDLNTCREPRRLEPARV